MEEFEKFDLDPIPRKSTTVNQGIHSFYDIPNHFPLLAKSGISQWLPKQFKQAVPKNFQIPIFTPTNSILPSTQHSFESPGKKIVSNKLNISDHLTGLSSKLQREKDKLKIKAKLFSLCDELEFTVRKIPSFQIKGVPTPTHTRYEMMKTVSPLKVTVEMPDRSALKTFSGKNRKAKQFKINIPEVVEKEKLQNKEWIYAYFLDAIRSSNGLSLPQTEKQTYKFFVGPGNNSGLIIRALRTRPWWIQSDNRKEAHFIWTSNKHQKTLKSLQSGKFTKQTPIKQPHLPAKKSLDSHKYGFNLILNSVLFQHLEPTQSLMTTLKLYNKLEENENICNKKLLFANLKNYYTFIGKQVFEVVPVTFHVKSRNDPGFNEFEKTFAQNEGNNIWIIKPGENTNRGKGISVSNSLEEIRAIVNEKCSTHTCIIQKYIDRPLLINKRKFDIRCFALLTSINSNLQGYFYTEGYIRTSSKEFSIKNLENKFIHLTNDAIQKYSEDYGKFESANKMSYSDLQNYLNANYQKQKINFERDILTKIKEIVTDTFVSVSDKIDPEKKLHCFELFGYDFMIDEDFKVWLIEANTNPCLETSCAFLSRVIPACIDNTLRLVLDPLFPPHSESKKLLSWIEDVNISNKFELVYNQVIHNQ